MGRGWPGPVQTPVLMPAQTPIWNLDSVEKFSCFGIYQGYPWYVPVLQYMSGISLVVAGCTNTRYMFAP